MNLPFTSCLLKGRKREQKERKKNATTVGDRSFGGGNDSGSRMKKKPCWLKNDKTIAQIKKIAYICSTLLEIEELRW